MSDNHSDHFIIPLKYYVGTLIALIILTVITVAVAQVDLGWLNIYVAMFVAVIKASFVLMFFMGMKWDENFNKVIFFGSLVFVAIFFAFVLFDVKTRDGFYDNEDEIFNIKSPVKIISAEDIHHNKSAH